MLPRGSKKINNWSDRQKIKTFTKILGSLLQSTEKEGLEHTTEDSSGTSLSASVPLFDSRITCVNEADAFFRSDTSSGQKTHELVKALINAGFEGIVLKAWEQDRLHVSCQATSASIKSQNWGSTFRISTAVLARQKYEDLKYLKLMRDSLARTCHRSIREDHGFSDNIASSKHRDYQIWSRWRDQGEERLQGRAPKAQSYPCDSSNLALHERLFSEVQDLVDRPAGSCCVCVWALLLPSPVSERH